MIAFPHLPLHGSIVLYGGAYMDAYEPGLHRIRLYPKKGTASGWRTELRKADQWKWDRWVRQNSHASLMPYDPSLGTRTYVVFVVKNGIITILP